MIDQGRRLLVVSFFCAATTQACAPQTVARPAPGSTTGSSSGSSATPGQASGTSAPVAASTPATGSAYHVSASASASNRDCTASAPCRTIAAGVEKLRPGDVLYIRAGTYAETLTWDDEHGPKGSDEAHRITIRAYPGETVILMPETQPAPPDVGVINIRCNGRGVPLQTAPGPCQYGRCNDACPSYITIGSPPGDGSRIVLDARRLTNGEPAGILNLPYDEVGAGGGNDRPTGPHHVRFQALEIRYSNQHGIFWGAGDYNEFLDLDVHDNGGPARNEGHGIYLSSMKNVVRGGTIHANAGLGIHLWNSAADREASYNTIDGVELYANGCTANQLDAAGSTRARICRADAPPALGLGPGRRNLVTHVDVHDNRNPGLTVSSGNWYAEIRDSTFTRNGLDPTPDGAPLGGVAVLHDTWSSEHTYDPDLQAVEYLPDWHGAHHARVVDNAFSGNVGGNTCSGQITVNTTSPYELSGNSCSP